METTSVLALARFIIGGHGKARWVMLRLLGGHHVAHHLAGGLGPIVVHTIVLAHSNIIVIRFWKRNVFDDRVFGIILAHRCRSVD